MTISRNVALYCLINALLCMGAYGAAQSQSAFEVGRSVTGNLAYNGVLTDSGAEQVSLLLVDGDVLSVRSRGGGLPAGIAMAEAVNAADGASRVGGHCYAECAASFVFYSHSLLVPVGATLLFTKDSLRQVQKEGAKILLSCIPDFVRESQYIWIAPSVMSQLGMKNVTFEWVVESETRPSYERFAGREIYWLDTCELEA